MLRSSDRGDSSATLAGRRGPVREADDAARELPGRHRLIAEKAEATSRLACRGQEVPAQAKGGVERWRI
jgi:hypothetical protein